MPTILLIRPANRLPEDVATCRQFGWQYIPFPPLNIVPHHERIDHLPERIEESDAVFWVSPTAVEVAGLNLSGSLKPHIAVGLGVVSQHRQRQRSGFRIADLGKVTHRWRNFDCEWHGGA